jgi:hypothetical protein
MSETCWILLDGVHLTLDFENFFFYAQDYLILEDFNFFSQLSFYHYAIFYILK